MPNKHELSTTLRSNKNKNIARKVATKYGICNIFAVKYVVLNYLLLLSGV